jgi:hypothetical protein
MIVRWVGKTVAEPTFDFGSANDRVRTLRRPARQRRARRNRASRGGAIRRSTRRGSLVYWVCVSPLPEPLA